jgi:hypothetical protein
MPLTRVEQIAMLATEAKRDYRELAELLLETRNLTAKQKNTALFCILRLAIDRNDDDAREELLPLLIDTGKIVRLPKPANAETG